MSQTWWMRKLRLNTSESNGFDVYFFSFFRGVQVYTYHCGPSPRGGSAAEHGGRQDHRSRPRRVSLRQSFFFIEHFYFIQYFGYIFVVFSRSSSSCQSRIRNSHIGYFFTSKNKNKNKKVREKVG